MVDRWTKRARERPTLGSAVSGVVPFKRSGLKDFSSDVEIRRRTAYIFPSTYYLSCTLDIVYFRSNTLVVVM